MGEEGLPFLKLRIPTGIKVNSPWGGGSTSQGEGDKVSPLGAGKESLFICHLKGSRCH